MSRRIEGASVIVTGSSGFIGSHLCRSLVKDMGCRVLGIDYMPPKYETREREGNGSTAHEVPAHHDDSKGLFSFLQVDISNSREIKSIFSKYYDANDFIFHLAAFANPRDCKTNFDHAFKVNVLGTKNVVEHSPKESRLIFMSSAAVYGTPTAIPIAESHPRNGTDPYAVTKIIGEDLCNCYFENYGYDICIGRNFNAFGEGQVTDYIIPTLIKQAVLGTSIEVWNTSPVRDFLYVEDTVNALITLAGYGIKGQIYNIGRGKGSSVGEMINMVKNIVNDDIKVVDLKKQVTGSNKLIADADRLKELGWNPRIDLEEGLRRTIEWFRNPKPVLAS